MSETDQTISLDQLLRVLRRRWWLIALLALAGAAVGTLLALATPTRYEATATVLIGGGSSAPAPGQLTAPAAARLVLTRSVAEAVSRELPDERSPGELLGAVSATADDTESFVDITAGANTAAGAAQLANAFAQEFVAQRSESLEAERQEAAEAVQRQLAEVPRRSPARSELASTLAELRATAVVSGVEGQLIDPAVATTDQAIGGPARWGAAGGGLGLLLGIILAFALGALDPRVRSLDELRTLVRAPQLAAMPAPGRRLRRRAAPPVLAARREPFEHLRGALLVLNGERRLRRIAITSPNDRNEGKTVVAANLAVSLARLGLRVCVVDTDLRHRALAPYFGLTDAGTGLADAARGRSLADVVQRFSLPSDDGTNGSAPQQGAEVDVVPAGASSADAAELLAGEGVREVLEDLGRNHDIVILDCAPLLAVSDALPLLEHSSGTVLVVRHSHTPRRTVARAERVVADARGTLLGVVATGVPKAELGAEGHGPWPTSAPATPRHEL